MFVCVKKEERGTKKADKDDFITSASVWATEGEVLSPLNSASASHRQSERTLGLHCIGGSQ